MIKKWRDFCGEMNGKGASVRAYFAGALLALGFWGVAFPQYLFTDDCVQIVFEDGREGKREDENLYREIGTAKPGQIEIKIGILEWLKTAQR